MGTVGFREGWRPRSSQQSPHYKNSATVSEMSPTTRSGSKGADPSRSGSTPASLRSSRSERSGTASTKSLIIMNFRAASDGEIGKPRVLFESSYDDYWIWPTYDVAADGRFLMVKTPPERAPRQVNIVLDWFEELERLVPAP